MKPIRRGIAALMLSLVLTITVVAPTAVALTPNVAHAADEEPWEDPPWAFITWSIILWIAKAGLLYADNGGEAYQQEGA